MIVRIIKKLGTIFTTIILCLLGIYIILVNSFPEQANNLFGYRLCNILTGSMEPFIPTDSIVIVKNINATDEIEPGTIITFHADRFNEDVLITHYFDHIEEDAQGNEWYRTHAYGVTTLDEFETKRDDIIGTYAFHIPYVGNLILFLKSPNAFVMYGLLIGIFIVYHLLSLYLDKLEEEENEKNTSQILQEKDFHSIVFHPHGLITSIDGFVHMQDIKICNNTKIYLQFFDYHDQFLIEYPIHIFQKEIVEHEYYWKCIMYTNKSVNHYQITWKND